MPTYTNDHEQALENDEGRPVSREPAQVEEEMHREKVSQPKDSTKSSSDDIPRSSFTTWLLTQRERQDIVGHFAKEVAYDTTWPADDTSRHRLHLYLNGEYAMDVVHEALDVAWYEWRTLVGEGVV
jgi:uncharacterized protein YozE (UPF0346 family)